MGWFSSVLASIGAAMKPLAAAFGFSALGPVKGSLAALWQSMIGNVCAGSIFATIQAFSMGSVTTLIPLLGLGWIIGRVVWGSKKN
jgi:hypothetical protein